MKNWKTTLSGAAVVIAGAFLFYIGKTVEGIALIPVGIGLISAKDHSTTGKGF